MNIAGPDLLAQYRSGVNLWPIITTVEGEFDLPPLLLWAVGSRETGLQRRYAEGQVHADGHGWGLFGADDRWNSLDLPYFASDVEEQAWLCARTLRVNFRRLGPWLDAVNAYGPAGARPAYGQDVLERASYLAAHVGGTMQLWHPRAQRVEPADGRTGLSLIGVPTKIVLHTTESDRYSPSPASYFGNPYWPHATIVPGTIYQHLPIDVGGYALYADGSVQTNRANAVQCEIVWRAANGDWPDELLDTVADWVRWVQEQTDTPTVIAEMFREGAIVASVDSPIRFGDQEWLDFAGICGHSNVPGGNDHWDPGRLPVDRLRERLGGNPDPDPVPQEEDDDTMRLIAVDNDRGIFLIGSSLQASGKGKAKALARHLGTAAEIDALVGAGVVPGYDKRPALPAALFDQLFTVVA